VPVQVLWGKGLRQSTNRPALPIPASKLAVALPFTAATIPFTFYFRLSRLTFNYQLLTRCVAAIAAAIPCAVVAMLAACAPFFSSSLSPVSFPLSSESHRFPAMPFACAWREMHVSRRFPAAFPPFPAASRPRGRHFYGGGNRKYSFPPSFSFYFLLFPFPSSPFW
jgi:hypothetical protein